MKKTLLLFTCFLATKAFAQSKITYIIPDQVEVSIKKEITKLHPDSTTHILYFSLGKEKEGQYRISMLYDQKKTNGMFAERLLKETNRVVLIDNKRYPVILDYDYTFGTPDENTIGHIGGREGIVSRSTILFHGFSVIFNSAGKVVSLSSY